jgi:hypothetical protein
LVVVRGALEVLFASAPARKPAEMVALLELEHELCVEAGVPIAEPAARAWLQAIGGGGKTAKLAKALCALGPGDGSVVRQAALEQLRGRVERAERWERIATATAQAPDDRPESSMP